MIIAGTKVILKRMDEIYAAADKLGCAGMWTPNVTPGDVGTITYRAIPAANEATPQLFEVAFSHGNIICDWNMVEALPEPEGLTLEGEE